MLIARIATDTSLGRNFDYEVPEELVPQLQAGALVRVSFGHREIEGVVMELSDRSDVAGKPLKSVLGIAQGRPLFSAAQLRLARWMSAYYMAPIERCLRVLAPPAVRGGISRQEGFLRRQYIRRAPGITEEQTALCTPRQKEILSRLTEEPEILSGFSKAWKVSIPTLKKLAAAGLAVIEERELLRTPLSPGRFLPSSPLPLNPEQSAALSCICEALREAGEKQLPPPRPILLHGVTASGKTEVYLQAIAEVLRQGKNAIVLVPEISLTPQTIQRFASRFGSIVAVLHSQLSAGERHDEWQRIYRGEAKLAVGPRSALFAPFENLGLIIVDEEHEPSYKQEETPRYSARDVAVMRAYFEHCALVLGSATPSLESWHNVSLGKYRLSTLSRRAVSSGMPHTVIVDMRSEIAKHGGARPVFSDTLSQAIKQRLENGEQVMLFLNRRGYAPVVSCPECGYTETCTECSVGMTYHRKDHVIRCHLCGAFREVPESCPRCGAEDIIYTGIGTQRVEAIAKKMFPAARIARMDVDVTSRKNSHEEILQDFRLRKIDILIGTQMIAKGLDFPNVTLAGILNADTGLNIPDFRAAERTFDLLAQMAGRVGRGEKPGDVIVQTTLPAEPAIVFAKTEDYAHFAAQELAQRQELHYPPFSHYVCITFRGENQAETAAYALRFYQGIGKSPEEAYIRGEPCPAILEKVRGEWHYQITLRGKDPRLLTARLRAVLSAYPPPGRVSVSIDIDAFGM